MNYLEIVLQGYFNRNSKKFLEKYFLREFKKAEKEQFFEADEFFNGCLKVIEDWEKHLQQKVFKRQWELGGMLHAAKNGTLNYADMKGKTIEQNRQETIEYCKQELADVRPDGIGSISFTVHLNSLTNGRVSYNMAYDELLQIKLAINKAFEATGSNDKTQPPQQSEKPKPEPKETELSERIKKHFGFFNRNCPRKHKQILNDTDFEKLIEWTIWYFENDFKVPEISEPIKVVNTNKTFVQLAFKYLFKKLHKSSPYPETLFDFYRSAFNPYSEDKKSNFEAVKNNDEVSTLR